MALQNTLLQRARDVFSCAGAAVSERDLLLLIGSLLSNSASNIPYHNKQELAYYGSTNNIHTITYKLNNVTVATQTLTYVNSAAADDDLVETSEITFP